MALSAGADDATVAPRVKLATAKTPVAGDDDLKITIDPEYWRLIAYIFFWSMCGFAITLSKVLVSPMLAKGPEIEGDTCGPFNRKSSDIGVELGKGFDLATQSHLIELFGFGNICTNWDYSPSRELTAMFYPLFEYSLLVYLVLNFFTIELHYQRGELPKWFHSFSRIYFPVSLLLCAWFRMIFVCIAYQNVQQHTAGFLGLQIALIMLAVQNTLFIYATKTAYEFLGGLKQTRIAALAYISCTLGISSVKITATIFIVMNGRGAHWTLQPSFLPGMCVGEVVDLIWMIFNAVLPVIISYCRLKSDYPLVISIGMKEPKYISHEEGTELSETQPLRTGGGSGSRTKYESAMDA